MWNVQRLQATTLSNSQDTEYIYEQGFCKGFPSTHTRQLRPVKKAICGNSKKKTAFFEMACSGIIFLVLDAVTPKDPSPATSPLTALCAPVVTELRWTLRPPSGTTT